ncbi:MAG: S41 family peptidase [Polyangiaceae bacterium]
MRTRAGLALVVGALASLGSLACDDGAGGSSGSTSQATSTSGAGGEGGALPAPPTPSADWCERLEAGPPGPSEPVPVAWSRAHASVRFFGEETDHKKVDGALAAALAGGFTSDALHAYAAATGVACALPASNTALGPATVTMDGWMAIVRPGTGTPILPVDAIAVVVDLRDLPAVPELADALDRAVSTAIATPVDRSSFVVRLHDGLTDEVYTPSIGMASIYANAKKTLKATPIPAAGIADRALAVLTDDKLAPAAAAMAISLRVANRAWIAGEDVLASVAEGKWIGVGADGIVHRDRSTGDWPDVVPADLRALDPIAAAERLFKEGPRPSAAPTGAHARSGIEKIPYALDPEPDEHSVGHTRALLTVAHGTLRTFFPYFPAVGDTIDQGLTTELDAIDGSLVGPEIERLPLRRFSNGFHDSHGFVFYFGDAGAPAGFVPLLLDEAKSGAVLVRTSGSPKFVAGDEIVSIDGVAVGALLPTLEKTTSASTPSALRRNALSLLTRLTGDSVWHVRKPAGTESDVNLTLAEATGAYPAVSTRTAGFLTDLGQPTVYYVNLDGASYTGTPNAADLVAAASGASALVLDGRGYPSTQETWSLVQRVLTQATSVKFRIPNVSTLGTELVEQDQPWAPLGTGTGHFDGPVVVLTGPWTQSQAEHILMPLVSTKRATFVGRQTAGANGNITGVMLPSSRGLTFTGMEVRFADGSTFHGVGIPPTVEVFPTAAGLAAGQDPELAAAIAFLGG